MRITRARMVGLIGVIVACSGAMLWGAASAAPAPQGTWQQAHLEADDATQLRKLGIPVAIPTYVPAGYFNCDISAGIDEKGIGHWYYITYCGPNENGTFFSIRGATLLVTQGQPAGGNKFAFRSPLFGAAALCEMPLYTGMEKHPGVRDPLSTGWLNAAHQGYPVYRLDASGIAPGEAVKIMESLRFLSRG